MKRNIHYDIIRAFAIICVVICHCSEAIYQYNMDGFNCLSLQSKLVMIAGLTIGRLGVPLFLFLTGALVLSKHFDNDDNVFSFYKSNLLNLLICYELWVIIYNLYMFATSPTSPELIDIFKEMFFLKQVPFSNMWYFPMIVEVYLCIPFLAYLVHKFRYSTIKICIFLLFINSIGLPTLNCIFQYLGINLYIESLLQTSFLRSSYIFMILVGYYSKQFSLTKIRSLIFIVLGLLGTFLLQFLLYSKGVVYNVWYNNFFLILCSFGIFKIIQKYEVRWHLLIKFTEYISKISLGIFFIHPIIYKLWRPLVVALNVVMPIKVCILFVLTFATCIITISVLSRIKFIKRYVFLVK